MLWVPKTYAKNYGLENIYNFTLKMFVYLILSQSHPYCSYLSSPNQGKNYLQTRHPHLQDLSPLQDTYNVFGSEVDFAERHLELKLLWQPL